MSTVTNTQVAVKYRRNVGSLSIDMSANNRRTTLGWHIDQHIGQVSVDISTDARPIFCPIYQTTHLSRHIDRHSTDMSADISIDTRPICRPVRQSTVGQCVNQYVSRGVHKIHMIQIANEACSTNLAIIISYPTSASRIIIVLLKTPPKYRKVD